MATSHFPLFSNRRDRIVFPPMEQHTIRDRSERGGEGRLVPVRTTARDPFRVKNPIDVPGLHRSRMQAQRRYPFRRQLNQGIIGSDDIVQNIPVVMGSAVGGENRLRIPARGFFPTVPAPIFCAGPVSSRP